MKVLLICGHASATQGWGNMDTSNKMKAALETYGHFVTILFCENNQELIEHLEKNTYDIVWSSIYYFTDSDDCINNISKQICVSDVLENMGVPFVGSDSTVMKNMIDKSKTLGILKKYGIETHKQMILKQGSVIKNVDFKKLWFVKPCFEAESQGIDENSIVHNMQELKLRVNYIWDNFNQPALVEEYLSGDEYTAAVIGNYDNCEILPIKNIIHHSAYEKYPVITTNLKTDKKLTFEIPYTDMEEIRKLCINALMALGFHDFIRIDLRKDNEGKIKIIEVNGIPGLNPIKSRIFEIYHLYNNECSKESNYNALVNEVITKAKQRLSIPEYSQTKGIINENAEFAL